MKQTKDKDCNIIKGVLSCCNAQDFEVFVAGKIKHSIFTRMFLYPENDQMIIAVRCKKCGKVISVFNSSCDGYGKCEKKEMAHISPSPINCIKCRNKSFSVSIKYEYPDVQELKELEIEEAENAFTWIYITLECNKCRTKYKNFVDYETT